MSNQVPLESVPVSQEVPAKGGGSADLAEYRAPGLLAHAKDDCGCHGSKAQTQGDAKDALGKKQVNSAGLQGEVCQGEVVVPVFFTTERKPVVDKQGRVTGFADEPNYVEKDGSVEVEVTRGKIYKRFKVDRGCRATNSEVQSIGWRTGQQCMGMKTDEIQTLSEEKYFAELNASLANGYTDKIDLFAPGYSIKFAGGIGQASEIEIGELKGRKPGDFNTDIEQACDVAGHGAHPVELFSWASNGHMLGYPADDRNVKYSLFGTWQKELKLRDERIIGGPKALNVIVHSKFAEPEIESMWIRGMLSSCQAAPQEKFNKIVLCASDYGLRTFALMADKVAENSDDITAVVNPNDKALWLSKMAHGGELPLGMASPADVMKYHKQLQHVRFVNYGSAIHPPSGYDPRRWAAYGVGHFPPGAVIAKITNNRENDMSDGMCLKEVPGTNHLYYELTTDCSSLKK